MNITTTTSSSLKHPAPSASRHGPAFDEAAVQLAPHAVVRAARWPVSGLMALAHAGQCAGAGTASHDERLKSEMQQLWQHTLGSPAFRKALAASHPELYARLRHTACPATLNKSARQLAATLYRHWARACWRTEPNGLWAGIGIAPLKPWHECRSEGTAGRVAVAPHLQPFAEMLQALSTTPDYRCHGRFKVHPSAWRAAPGVWVVRVRDASGADRSRRLQLRHIDVEAADRCIHALASLGPLPHGALVRVAERLLQSTEKAEGLVQQLMEARCLTGGLSLPHLFETAWEALALAGEELQPAHRSDWMVAVEDLRLLCQRLEQRHASLGAEDVWQAHADAATRIEALAVQLGVGPVALPRACLHWDAGLPAPVRFDAAVLELAQRALAAHEHHHHRADPLPAIDFLHARAHDRGNAGALRRTLAAHTDADGLAEALSRDHGDDGGLAQRLQALRGQDGPSEPGPAAMHAAPFGALMLRLGRRSALVQGLSHEPWLTYARFGALLGREAPHAHPLHGWCDRALGLFARSANVKLAQLGTAWAPLANLLAQPRFDAASCLDPYGTTPGAMSDAGLQLCHDGERRWLQSPTEAKPILVLGATALDLGARDTLLERLLLTGWRYRPPVSAAALHDGGPEGRALRLADDVLLRRPRHRLEGEAAIALAHASPAERWARWQALARDWSLPDWVTVSRDGEPALPMPRDSALAVEVAFRAPGATQVAFEIEIPEDECWLTDQEGNRHATELILVFARRHHAWNLRGDPLAPVPADPGAAEAAVLDGLPA